MKKLKNITRVNLLLIIILTLLFCVSCQSVYRLLFVRSYVDLDYNFSLQENTEEINCGAVRFNDGSMIFPARNDILIDEFQDYFREEADCRADRFFTCYDVKYSPKIHFNYEKGNGIIQNISIEKMPGKYKFDRINPVMEKTSTIIAFGGVDVGNSEDVTLDDVYIKQDVLPVCITHFKVRKQRYNLVIKDYIRESVDLSLRDIIRNEEQIYYISDDCGNVLVSFSLREYKTYSFGQMIEEEILPVVGAYCCVFNLLNAY